MPDNSINKGGTGPAAVDETPAVENTERTRDTEASGSTGEHAPAGDRAVESLGANERTRNRNLIIVGCVALVVLLAIFGIYRTRTKPASPSTEKTTAVTEKAETSQSASASPVEVVVPAEAMADTVIEIAGVTQRPAVALLSVTGSVEANQQQMQQVTPLVGGRVERVNVALGDRVAAGAALATIASPQVAEMRGNLRSAETKLSLAERNMARVQRSENRVAVLSAKAKLDQAEATLRRTRKLIELGVGAGKDLIAAETEYKTAKAEYDFQSNIALNREVQQARADVETARSEVAQIRQSLSALGAEANAGGGNSSFLAVRAPVSGTVTERLINAGAGIDAGKPLFTISNLSNVWVIANVPEAQVGNLRPGTPAEIRSSSLGSNVITGRVNYIDPRLNEETRTSRVRVEVPNAGERLKVGMFVEVGFQTGTGAQTGEELVVPATAVQRIGGRNVVFIPEKKEPGHFQVRDVEVGEETGGYRKILNGLALGDRVVTKGSFTLKSQLMKGQFGDND